MDIYNCFDVIVESCIFENNGPVTVSKFVPFRGHSGGLSVAFNFTQPLNRTRLTATISDIIFRNNSASASVSGAQSTTQFLRSSLVPGRGGGCAVVENSKTPLDVLVTRCTFERNSALTYGGGMFMSWSRVSNHTTTITDSSFIENDCPGAGAGGLVIGFDRSGPDEIADQLLASNVRFIGNTAVYGGGAYVFIASKSSMAAWACLPI